MRNKNGLRILVVDRDLDTLTALDSMLSRDGYLVTLCPSFADAWKVVAGHKIDLVVAGTRDPGVDALELVWKIKDLSPATRVILVLDPREGQNDPDVLAAGVDGVLHRPLTESRVVEEVTRLLDAVSS